MMCSWWFFLLFASTLRSQNRYDIVIDEIMADPTPQVGLPAVEWLELRNTCPLPINLQNWRIGDAAGQSGNLPAYILRPDSVVMICSSGSLAQLTRYGPAISVSSFPALDNDGDQLYLKSPAGRIIHSVSYSTDWYQNDLKKEGGWTLEMIDVHNPCTGMANWKASIDQLGGSPGKINSINGLNPDRKSPQVLRSYCTDSTTVLLVADEPLDSTTAVSLINFSIPGHSIQQVTVLPPMFTVIQLKLADSLSRNKVYTVTVSGLKDCSGNQLDPATHIKTGLPSEAVAGEWIINEILFDPRPGEFDYVEFQNISQKIFDAAKLFIANRNTAGNISSIRALSGTPYNIYPGDYIVATEEESVLNQSYFVSVPANVIRLTGMPSMPNDTGEVITLNGQGAILDEVDYDQSWHFPLLRDAEGVALERIRPGGPSNNSNNWHSASASSGYGTPTARNSQYLQDISSSTISISAEVFSPDNDGMDDILSINYELKNGGYVANIIVYSSNGRPVRKLVANGIAGFTGSWTWDGLDDQRRKLPIGTYVVYIEFFNLQGKKITAKKPVLLIRKLN
jgi:hypothetical protein